MRSCLCRLVKILVGQLKFTRPPCLSPEVNLQERVPKPLIPFIKVLGHLQKIEYEGLHIIYFEFDGYRHQKEAWPKPMWTEVPTPIEQENVPTSSITGSSGPSASRQVGESILAPQTGPYGPWMLPRKFCIGQYQTDGWQCQSRSNGGGLD